MDYLYKENIVDFPFFGKQSVDDFLSMMPVVLRKEGIIVLNKNITSHLATLYPFIVS